MGLYLSPAENAVVLCMDETTDIQALDRPMPNKPVARPEVERITNKRVRHESSSPSSPWPFTRGR